MIRNSITSDAFVGLMLIAVVFTGLCSCSSDPEPLLQAVVTKMTVPDIDHKADCSYDFNADGVADNQLSEVFKRLSGIGYDPQASVDVHIAQGIFALIYEIDGTDSLKDADVIVKSYAVFDDDGGAQDNFSGVEKYHVDSQKSKILIPVKGSIRQGKLILGPQDMPQPVPLELRHSDMPLVGLGKQIRIEVNLSLSSMQNMTQGCVTGLIPWTEIEGKTMSLMADYLTEKIKMPTNPKADLHKTLMDSDGNGIITADEVLALSPVLNLSPDVDSDGDGTLDALSMGIQFEAVSAILDSGNPKKDTLACYGIIRCIDRCQQDMPSCIESCRKQGTTSSRETFDAVHACLQASSSVCPEQCVEPLIYECINCLEHDNCLDVFTDCYADFN